MKPNPQVKTTKVFKQRLLSHDQDYMINTFKTQVLAFPKSWRPFSFYRCNFCFFPIQLLQQIKRDHSIAEFSLGHRYTPGSGCSKLTTSLVNVSLKFQMSISHVCQYFLLKKCKKLLQCSAKASLIFSTKVFIPGAYHH